MYGRFTFILCIVFLLFALTCDAFVRVHLEKKWGLPRTRHKEHNEILKEQSNIHDSESLVKLFGNLAETRIYYATVYIKNQPFSVLIGRSKKKKEKNKELIY